ncbi:MAG TPA: sigma-70 family RNA polymerase sigma factor [Thermoanaerobaculia bacterium]|nr:sigma-70 family RNA polymerase sigma factor [Thermoanaerobaculia bacterium]
MSSEDAADRVLVEEYLRRVDEGAFLALYRRHTPALFGLAARLCGGERHDAEEIVQEAWVRAARAMATFRWGSSLRTWLSGFIVNGWRELLRARRRSLPREEEPDAGETEIPVAERIDLDRAVAQLPDGFRTVLVLHDVEGFTHEEIGRLLGIEKGTSKSQLARARQAVRRHLACRRPASTEGERDARSGQ